MKQIFITTRITSLKALFRDTNYENNANSFEIPFSQEEEELSLHIVSDDIVFPSVFAINKDVDRILFHDSSTETVKSSIKNSFNQRKGGSHIANSFHEAVFKILFEKGENKVKRIIKYLFPEELENALNFLHDIYIGKDVSEVKEKHKSLTDIRKYDDLIENFNITKFNYENHKHHQKLARLRDDLLRKTVPEYYSKAN